MTTPDRAAALARAADREARCLRQVRAIERVAGPLACADDVPIAAARAEHGPALDALARVRSRLTTKAGRRAG